MTYWARLGGASSGHGVMLDLAANPRLRRLHRIARLRVTFGFVVAVVALWLATPSCSSITAGVAIAVVGELLRFWASGHLRKGQELTSSGPYRFTRHPLYLGSLIIGVGFFIAAADVLVACLVLGYLVPMFSVAIALEDATLRATFGSDYDRYVAGWREHMSRGFSLTQAVRNGEHQAVLGFVGVLALLGLKVWFSAV